MLCYRKLTNPVGPAAAGSRLEILQFRRTGAQLPRFSPAVAYKQAYCSERHFCRRPLKRRPSRRKRSWQWRAAPRRKRRSLLPQSTARSCSSCVRQARSMQSWTQKWRALLAPSRLQMSSRRPGWPILLYAKQELFLEEAGTCQESWAAILDASTLGHGCKGQSGV